MMKPHVLVVEDDDNTRMTLAYLIQHAGYNVTQAHDGETALELLEQKTFHVVLTDIILGNVSGIDVLHAARHQLYRPEVILLTGHGSLDTAIDAVNEGAFAYLLKPCVDDKILSCIEGAAQRHTSERQIRDAAENLIKVLHHHTSRTTDSDARNPAPGTSPATASTQEMVRVGELAIGKTRHEVTFQGKYILLTPIEYALLSYLAQHVGSVCGYQDIIQVTHQLDTNDADAQMLLGPHIRNLRKKLAPAYIITVRGAGYKLVAPAEE
jgi:DNA-binding response OmpR family regulator